MRASGRNRAGDPVDSAMRHLVALVVEDTWNVRTAGRELRQAVHDDAVLRLARARVSWALAERASAIGERVAVTIDTALALTPTSAVVTRRRRAASGTSGMTNARRELG